MTKDTNEWRKVYMTHTWNYLSSSIYKTNFISNLPGSIDYKLLKLFTGENNCPVVLNELCYVNCFTFMKICPILIFMNHYVV